MIRALVLVALWGCLRSPDGFRCTSDSDCMDSSTGRCEQVGYCSFPDSSCTSGNRFSALAGMYSGQCTVGAPRFLVANSMHGFGLTMVTLPLEIPDDSNLYLVVSVVLGAGAPTTITYGNVGLSRIDWIVGVTGNQYARTEQWGVAAPPTGANDIIVKIGSGGDTVHIGAMAFANVNQTAPVAAMNEGNGDDQTATLSLATSQDDLVVSTTGQGAMIAGVQGAETVRFLDNATGNHTLDNAAGGTAIATPPMTSFTWGYSGVDTYQMIAIALQP